jgi:hypothetical protein
MKSVRLWHSLHILLRFIRLRTIIIHSSHDAQEINVFRAGLSVRRPVPMLHLEKRWKDFRHTLHCRIVHNDIEIS